MARTKISEFSSTPGNNTDIDGINIGEGCAPSGINDAIRELMAQLKDFQAGDAGDSITVVGTLAAKGTSTAAADLKLYEDTDNGTNYVGFIAPASIASNVQWTLPSADGSSGQALQTNGSGTLSFATLGISAGGTGQTTANAALNALLPSQTSANGRYLKSDGTNASWDQLDISTADITGTLPIANGGTGQTTANAAFNALAPSQTGNSGKYLTTDGTNTSWATNPLGTVTSVDVSGGTTGLTTSGGPVTSSGTITLAGTLATTNGGTGLTSFTANGVVYASSSSALTTGSGLTWNGSTLLVGGNTRFGSGAVIPGFATASDASLANNASLRGTNAAGSTAFELIKLNTSDQVVINNDGADAVLTSATTSVRWTIGSEQMRLTSTGLGIGTSSPSTRIHASIASATAYSSSSTGNVLTLTNTTASGYAGIAFNTEPSSGNAGIAAINSFAPASGDSVLTFSTRTSATLSEKLRLDSSGNLGLGVTPSAWGGSYKAIEFHGISVANLNAGTNQQAQYLLNAYDSAAGAWKYKISSVCAAMYRQSPDGSHEWHTAPSGTAGNAISFTQAMTLDASGNLLVGKTSPAYGATNRGLLEVNGASTALIGLSVNNVAAGYLYSSGSNVYVGAPTGQSILFDINGERARITSGGYFKASDSGSYIDPATFHEFTQTANSEGLQVRATNASYSNTAFQVRASRNTTNNSFYYISCYNDGAANYRMRVADSGDLTNVNGTYGTISDAKMKTDIVDAGSQWADIKAIRFRKFKMKDDPDQRVQLGVVAQELEQTSPGLVDEHIDRDAEGNDLGTTTKSVKTSVLLMKSAVALQEAMKRIEELESRLAAAGI